MSCFSTSASVSRERQAPLFKRFYVWIDLRLLAASSFARANVPVDANLYIFTVDSSIVSSSASGSFIVPSPNINYQLCWEEEGDEASNNSGGPVHVQGTNYVIDFGTPGVYRIKIDPVGVPSGVNDFNKFGFNNFAGGDKGKFIALEQWGSTQWISMSAFFYGATNFTGITATDTPNLSAVTNFENIFRSAPAMVNAIGLDSWETANVNTMRRAFDGSAIANLEVGSWNMTSVTDTSFMFANTLWGWYQYCGFTGVDAGCSHALFIGIKKELLTNRTIVSHWASRY